MYTYHFSNTVSSSNISVGFYCKLFRVAISKRYYDTTHRVNKLGLDATGLAEMHINTGGSYQPEQGMY